MRVQIIGIEIDNPPRFGDSAIKGDKVGLFLRRVPDNWGVIVEPKDKPAEERKNPVCDYTI